jgi:hypothetical protein
MWKWLTALGFAALAVAGGLYWGLALYPTEALRAQLDAAVRGLPPGTQALYATASYGVFSHRATLTGVTIHRQDPDGFDLSIDELEVTGPAADFAAAWARAAADPATLTPGQGLPLADAITAYNIAYSNANSSATLASFTVARPRLFPWALLHQGVPSIAAAEAQLLARAGPVPDGNALLPLLRAEATFAAGMAYDGYAAQGLAAKANVPANLRMPAQSVAYNIRSIESGPYDRGDFASLALEGLTMHGGLFGDFAAGSVAFQGVAARQALAQLLDAKVFTSGLLDGLALKRVAYASMSMTPPDGTPMTMGAMTLSDIAVADGVLVSAALAIDDVHLRTADLKSIGAAANYAMLGVDELTLGLHAQYGWDTAKGQISVSDATFDVAQLGSLKLAFEIDGASSWDGLRSAARLKSASLRYEDASLVKRIIALAAAQRGTDPQSLRQRLMYLCAQIMVAPGAAPATIETARAMSAFLADPQSLEVRIVPPAPIAPGELLMLSTMPPAEMVPRLGLMVRANR